MFDGSNFNRLAGGRVRKALTNDLSQVNGDEVVCFGTSNMGVGFDLEAYWISIPGPNVMWVHDLTEGTWQRLSSSNGWLTSTAQVAVL
jgi:hypothetical protein